MSNVASPTFLEAVNEVLAAAGEPPVDSVDTEGLTSVAFAYSEILKASRRIQTQRCISSNRVVTLELDTNSKFRLPAWVLFVYQAITSDGQELIHYGDYLVGYDGTLEFDAGTTVELEYHFGAAYESLPSYVRDYIIAEASYEFIRTRLGAPELIQSALRRREEARMNFNRLEILGRRPSALENTTSYKILNRKYNPNRWGR